MLQSKGLFHKSDRGQEVKKGEIEIWTFRPFTRITFAGEITIPLLGNTLQGTAIILLLGEEQQGRKS